MNEKTSKACLRNRNRAGEKNYQPTTVLDPIMDDVINDPIVKRANQLVKTVLSNTHDMANACKIADRIAIIYLGKLIWSGLVPCIDHYGNDHLDQFINGRTNGPIQMEM